MNLYIDWTITVPQQTVLASGGVDVAICPRPASRPLHTHVMVVTACLHCAGRHVCNSTSLFFICWCRRHSRKVIGALLCCHSVAGHCSLSNCQGRLWRCERHKLTTVPCHFLVFIHFPKRDRLQMDSLRCGHVMGLLLRRKSHDWPE